jgi:CRP/FNR family transcriptional regulator
VEISLSNHILRKTALDETDIGRLASFVEIQQISKKSRFILPEDSRDTLLFVERGLLRQYTIDTGKREHTLQFGVEGCWLGNWRGLAVGGHSPAYFQAVEESRVAVLKPSAYARLLEALPPLERYFLKVHQRAHSAALQRIQLLTSSDGFDRYRRFQRRYHAFVRRVPQYMLASFLGFTPEWLSKIRASR